MQQNKQETIADFNQGVNLCLMALFSVNRSVQIWSRIPGTTGAWFFGWMFFLGLGIQAWYYVANAHAAMAYDFVTWELTARASGMWFCVHGVARAFQTARGLRFHSYESGVGILEWMFPTWQASSAALASDLMVAMALSIAMWLLWSPILSGWYAAMGVWLLLAHWWMRARDSRRAQAWLDSQLEAERWSDQIQER